MFFFFSSRRRHTRSLCDWSSDVCSSDLRGARGMKLLFMNGPNLNLLGTRDPEMYGRTTLKEVEARCREIARQAGCDLVAFQSNHEGALIRSEERRVGKECRARGAQDGDK